MRFDEKCLTRCLVLVAASVAFAPLFEAPAYAAPPAPSASTKATREELVAHLEAEYQQLASLTRESAGIDRGIKVTAAQLANVERIGGALFASVGAGEDAKSRLASLLAMELASAGIAISPSGLAALVDQITKGGAGAMALATFICLQIAEATADSTTKRTATDGVQSASDLAAPGKPLDVVALGKLFKASTNKPGSVPIAFADIEPLKVTRAAATSYVLDLIRRHYRAHATTMSQRIQVLKLATSASQQRILTLKAELAKRV